MKGNLTHILVTVLSLGRGQLELQIKGQLLWKCLNPDTTSS